MTSLFMWLKSNIKLSCMIRSMALTSILLLTLMGSPLLFNSAFASDINEESSRYTTYPSDSSPSLLSEVTPQDVVEQTKGLEVRLHPDSPQVCSLEIIEIGKTQQGQFLPMISLLRDTKDADIDPDYPKIRKIYSYDMAYSPRYEYKNSSVGFGNNDDDSGFTEQIEVAGPPVEIVGVSGQRVASWVNFIWEALYSTSQVAGIFGTPFILTDEVVKSFRNRIHYFRTRALYSLRLLLQGEDSELFQHVSRTEVEKIYGSGLHYNWKGVLVTKEFQQLSYTFDKEDREAKAVENMTRLVNVLNREGLYVHPLNKDFVLVYYDPSQKRSRELDTEYLDANLSTKVDLKNKKDLVLLGGYGISQINKQLNVIDSGNTRKQEDRNTLQFLVDIGERFGAIFLPAPFNIFLILGSTATEFVLKKKGTPILTSLLETEAELMALIDSGMAEINLEAISFIKEKMNRANIRALKSPEANRDSFRKSNALHMTEYLQSYPQHLCDEIKLVREKEFKNDYLHFSEKLAWNWNSFLSHFNSDVDKIMSEQKRSIIKSRANLVASRKLLKAFDESRSDIAINDATYAVLVLSLYKEDQDVSTIGRLIENSVNDGLELAAVKAAGRHQSYKLASYLTKKVREFSIYENVLQKNPVLIEAFLALAELNYGSEEGQAELSDVLKLIETIENRFVNDERKLIADFGRHFKSKIVYFNSNTGGGE